jgi:hypothetical protein
MTNLELSSFVFVFLGTLVFTLVGLVVFQMLRQSRESNLIQKELMNVVLHSSFSDRRSDLEDSLMNLAKGFQKNPRDFADVSHLALRGQSINERKDNRFLKSLGLEAPFQEKKDQIFVLTPFAEAEKKTFAFVRGALSDAGFQVLRGDEEERTDLLGHIVKSMVESRLIVANLNGRNPNVMYELGIAHMLDKPVILIANVEGRIEEIPIDLRAKNILLYDTDSELEEKLTRAVLQILK